MNHTRIYLEGHHILAPHLAEYADALAGANFEVTSEWHDPGKNRLALISEIITILSRCDVLIIWLSGAKADTWTKVGYALASGIRVIGIGQVKDCVEVTSVIPLRVDTWEDLAMNNFEKLGSARFKKGKR